MGRRGRPRHPDILTPREWEVLELVRQRLSNEQIAERLGISFDGAKYHVSQILSKLGVATREEAASLRLQERRRWRASWPLWARIAGATTLAAAVAGLAVLAWAVLQTSGDDNGAAGVADAGDAFVCGEWSRASSTLGSVVTQRYGEIRNCVLVGNSWVITTLGTADSTGVIGVYRCAGSDTACLDGRNDHPFSRWTFYSPPFPGAVTLLEKGDSDRLIISNAGHQLTFEVATGAFGESSVCVVPQAPPEKAGPLKMRFGQGTVCWTDVDNEASYRVEGSVHYIRGGCDASPVAPGSEDVPFSTILAANSTTFTLPRPQDPRLSFLNAVTVSVEALDASGATLVTDSTGSQLDDFCEPSPSP